MAATIRKIGGKLAVALRHPSYHTTGFCNICRHHTLFICDAAEDRWIRRCLLCRSTPKYRAIVHVIEAQTGVPIADCITAKRIFELSTTSPIFRKLRGHPNYEASGYFSDKPFGEQISPYCWNQDLQQLSFSSESFDVVISSETMEHVRRPWQGFSEVHRVLKAGGFYVFTIPFRSDRVTRSRVDTSGDEDVHVMPKIYHIDPYRPEDSLVYTDFGVDLPDLLQPLGFDTEIACVLEKQSDIQDDLRPVTVFVAHKRAAQGRASASSV